MYSGDSETLMEFSLNLILFILLLELEVVYSFRPALLPLLFWFGYDLDWPEDLLSVVYDINRI